MDYTTAYTCPFCGEENELFVEPEDGDVQMLTEDCSVCCRPIDVRIRILDEDIIAEAIGDA